MKTTTKSTTAKAARTQRTAKSTADNSELEKFFVDELKDIYTAISHGEEVTK